MFNVKGGWDCLVAHPIHHEGLITSIVEVDGPLRFGATG